MEAKSVQAPVEYMTVGDRTFWRHAGRWHSDNEGLAQEAVYALLVTRAMRQNDHMNRAMAVAAMSQVPVPAQRGSVPADVKQLVWKRDGGACRACGSGVELQYDHVIPVSLGGRKHRGQPADPLRTVQPSEGRRHRLIGLPRCGQLLS